MTITTEYTVTGMTCEHCERSVAEEIESVAGVTAIDVSATAGRLRLASEAPLDDAAVLAAVDEAGYSATRTS